MLEIHQEPKSIVVTSLSTIYQYFVDSKEWVKVKIEFPKSVDCIHGVYEIDNVFYVAGTKSVSTLNGEFYKLPLDHRLNTLDEHVLCTPCLVGNKILLIAQVGYDDYDNCVEKSKMFDPTSKQWSDANIETERVAFAAVEYLNKVWIVGGYDRAVMYAEHITTNTIQIYDPVLNTTTLSPVKMIQARESPKVIVYNDKLFVLVDIFHHFVNL